MKAVDSRPDGDRAAAVFVIFLRLGCLSFGGPVAHLGFFRTEFVERRRWLTDHDYAELLALAQTLPGPASSQVGFALGLLRAGAPGAIAAFTGFTLPSAVLMLAFAFGHAVFAGPIGQGILHGLQLAAVAVVAQAVWSMQRNLAPDRMRIAIALGAAVVVFATPPAVGTLAAILLGALAGLVLLRKATAPDRETPPIRITRRAGLATAMAFAALLVAAFTIRLDHLSGATMAASFYRTGALVFGGGHVVLPLLESSVVAHGWVSQPDFLAGYGAAQALPGPLFAFAAYLGAAAHPSAHPIVFGLIALLGIFLPGFLLISAVLPFWSSLRTRPHVQPILQGINAAVVGILFAALCRPVISSTIHHATDAAIALAGFTLLVRRTAPPWAVVLGSAVFALLVSAITNK